jgi:hypothetical protein
MSGPSGRFFDGLNHVSRRMVFRLRAVGCGIGAGICAAPVLLFVSVILDLPWLSGNNLVLIALIIGNVVGFPVWKHQRPTE